MVKFPQKLFLLFALAVSILSVPHVVNAQQLTRADLPRLAKKTVDRHLIIVRLKDSNAFAAKSLSEGPAAKKARMRIKRNAKISELRTKFTKRTKRKIRTFSNPKLMSTDVSRAELSRILDDPELVVFENRLHKPFLAESVPSIYPSQATSGLDGSGWAVAILDTGVNKNHAFYSGKIIEAAEACFSTNFNPPSDPEYDPLLQSIESLCPAGADSATGADAGVNCSMSLNGGCDHGTKMAGIVAGSDMSMNGVAPGASLIPIQVYSKSTDQELVCDMVGLTQPCVFALTSDIIAALEYVYSIRSSYQIAAVNLSLGSGLYPGECDFLPEKDAIDDLLSVGIATVAASGNSGNSSQMASPACVSTAIGVAATNDVNDQPWLGNNRSGALDFFAPGVGISTSTLPTSTFSVESGTSVAAAHVSGAWAIMKNAGASSVSQIENLFKSTGELVTQTGGVGVSKKRIDITEALDLFNAPPVNNDDDEFCFPVKASNGNVAVICL